MTMLIWSLILDALEWLHSRPPDDGRLLGPGLSLSPLEREALGGARLAFAGQPWL